MGRSAGKSFWNHDVAAICNLKCNQDKISSRLLTLFGVTRWLSQQVINGRLFMGFLCQRAEEGLF